MLKQFMVLYVKLNISGNFYDEGHLLRLHYLDNAPYEMAARLYAFSFSVLAVSEVLLVIQKYHDMKSKDLKIN